MMLVNRAGAAAAPRRRLPCCRFASTAAPAAKPKRNALKMLQSLLLRHDGGARGGGRGKGAQGGGRGRGWSPNRRGASAPGVPSEAWAIVESLSSKGQLTPHHCTAVLTAVATPDEVGRIARLADDAHLQSDLPVVRTLFKAWCRCGHHAYAVAVLRDAVERGVLPSNEAAVLATKPLADAAEQRQQPWQLFRLLQSSGFADRYHYNIMLPLCESVGDDAMASSALTAREGDSPSTVSALLEELRESGGDVSTDTFNTRLGCAIETAGGSEGWTDSAVAAVELVGQMRYAGMQPDARTYSLLHTCYLGATPTPAAAAAADVLAEARAVVPREWSAEEVSSTATLALRDLRASDSPDLAWEYFSALQVGGLADAHHLAEVMHLCEDSQALSTLVAQAALQGSSRLRRGSTSARGGGVVELAMHQHLARLGEVAQAASTLADFSRAKGTTTEPYKISSAITAVLREMCDDEQGQSAAQVWVYFESVQQHNLADVFHYNLMLRQCNTVDGVERLLREMSDDAKVPRNHATAGALHMTWAQLGKPSRAADALAGGVAAGGWPDVERRRRVVRHCLAVLLQLPTAAEDDALQVRPADAAFAYLREVEDAGLLRRHAGGGKVRGQLMDDPYAVLLDHRMLTGPDGPNGPTQRQQQYEEGPMLDPREAEQEREYLAALLVHAEGRAEHVVLEGRGCALFLRRAGAAGAPELAAKALELVETDPGTHASNPHRASILSGDSDRARVCAVSRSKLATSTMRSLAAFAEAGKLHTQSSPRLAVQGSV